MTVAMQGVSFTGISQKGLQLLLLWLFLQLIAHVAAFAHEETTKNASSTSNASHPSIVPPFYDRNGDLTKDLFTLVTSTKIKYEYRIWESHEVGQPRTGFGPCFTRGKNRWDVIVGDGVGFRSLPWRFGCKTHRNQVHLAEGGIEAYVNKSLFFGWWRKCRDKEKPIYVTLFVRGLHVYVRAYTNKGVGKDMELVADIGLAKQLPVDCTGRVCVGGAGKQYLDAVLRQGGKKRKCMFPSKNAGMKRMRISAEGDEELEKVFPSTVDYTQLYRKQSFHPISDFILEAPLKTPPPPPGRSVVQHHKNGDRMSIEFLMNPS